MRSAALIFSGLASIWLLLMNGCAAGVVAAAGATAGFALAQGQAEAFINGELKAARMVPLDQTVHAVKAAFVDMQTTLTIERYRTRGAYLVGQAQGGPE